MNIVLVQPPIALNKRLSLTPPLGLLTIAANVDREHHNICIVDCNLKGYQDEEYLNPNTFYQDTVDLILSHKPDLVGCTSMAIESHVSIELLRLIKTTNEDVLTVLGGPHFSSIATDLLDAYQWVDFVCTGEADHSFPKLIEHLGCSKSVSDIHGVTSRGQQEGKSLVSDSKPSRNINTSETMKSLPMPAYDLVNLEEYFKTNPRCYLPIEHARGCQLRCSFCYSEAHWGHGEQTASIPRIIDSINRHLELGAKSLFFVADNFLSDPATSIKLCEEMAKISKPFTWDCYATLAPLNVNTISAMSKAGCRSVFVGIDAISSFNKKQFRKTYFKSRENIQAKISILNKFGIKLTAALMISPFDTADGREDTIQTGLWLMELGCNVYFNSLIVYHGTNLTEQIEFPAANVTYSSIKPRLLFQSPNLISINQYSQKRPDLFPIHNTVTQQNSDLRVNVFCFLASYMCYYYPNFLSHLIKHNSTKLTSVINTLVDIISPKVADENDELRDDEIDTLIANKLKSDFALTISLKLIEFDLLSFFTPNQNNFTKINTDDTSYNCKINPFVVMNKSLIPTRVKIESNSSKHHAEILVCYFFGKYRCIELNDTLVEILDEIRNVKILNREILLHPENYNILKSAHLLSPTATAN